jgi:predicted small secreted protein
MQTEVVMTTVEWVLLLCFVAVGILSGNTTEGIAQGIETTGEKFAGAARDAIEEVTDNDE